MKRLFGWWQRVPRLAHIGCNLLLIAVLLAASYLFRGCPPLSVEHAYRRAAAQEMVDAGEILGVVQGEIYFNGGNTKHYRLAAAKNDAGVMLYSFRSEDIGFFKRRADAAESFTYGDRTGVVTLLADQASWYISESDRYAELPIILFDEVPQAVRAELDLYVDIGYWGYDEVYEYHLTAQREQAGFFEFRIAAGDVLERQSVGIEAYALNTIQWIFKPLQSRNVDSFPAVVRLYDREDRLIYEEEMIVGSEQEVVGHEN